MKKYIVKILFSLQLVSSLLLGQGKDSSPYISAEPVGGWDSLKSKISYSEILRRSTFWSIYMVDFTFDSVGSVEKFNPTKRLHFDRDLNIRTLEGYEKYDSSFVVHIESVLKSVKWKPIAYDAQVIKGRVKVPIIFNLFGFSKRDGIIINVPLPIVNVSY